MTTVPSLEHWFTVPPRDSYEVPGYGTFRLAQLCKCGCGERVEYAGRGRPPVYRPECNDRRVRKSQEARNS